MNEVRKCLECRKTIPIVVDGVRFNHHRKVTCSPECRMSRLREQRRKAAEKFYRKLREETNNE